MGVRLGKLVLIVEDCMKRDVQARNSDWRLYSDVCKCLGHNPDNITINDLANNPRSFPSFESVSRARRKVQEQNKYVASDNVTNFRRQQELIFREEMA